jgi:hypothetical protein
MQYEYHFYIDSREGIGSIISTDAPLPHIQVGHTLLLELPELATKMGHYWEILSVEVYLFLPADGPSRKVTTYVSLHEQARSPEQ